MLKNIELLIKMLKLGGILIPFTSLLNNCSVKRIFHSKLPRTYGYLAAIWPSLFQVLDKEKKNTLRVWWTLSEEEKNKEESCRNRLFPIKGAFIPLKNKVTIIDVSYCKHVVSCINGQKPGTLLLYLFFYKLQRRYYHHKSFIHSFQWGHGNKFILPIFLFLFQFCWIWWKPPTCFRICSHLLLKIWSLTKLKTCRSSINIIECCSASNGKCDSTIYFVVRTGYQHSPLALISLEHDDWDLAGASCM